MSHWTREVNALRECLEGLVVRDGEGGPIETDRGFEIWIRQTLNVRQSRGTVFFIGNGASASMASHYAADLAKTVLIRTQTFYDLSLLTALGNDISFEEVFSIPLQRWMSKGDMLVAISSSGMSPNILRGVEKALETGGYVATLSAMDPENQLRTMGMINLYVPARTYGMAESSHNAVLHHWLDGVADNVVS